MKEINLFESNNKIQLNKQKIPNNKRTICESALHQQFVSFRDKC